MRRQNEKGLFTTEIRTTIVGVYKKKNRKLLSAEGSGGWCLVIQEIPKNYSRGHSPNLIECSSNLVVRKKRVSILTANPLRKL